MPVTIRDVARQAGVSPMTVSYVLRGEGQRFRAETRQRVLRVAEVLGYRANGLPKAMRSGCFRTVGLIASSAWAPIWLAPTMLEAIADALGERDWNLLYCRLQPGQLEHDGTDPVPRLLRETHADGLLVNCGGREMVTTIEAALGSYPVVWLNAWRDSDAVAVDDRAAGRLAAEHLAACGHRRLGYFQCWHSGHASMEQRHAGFRQRAEAAGIGVHSFAPAAEGAGLSDRQQAQALAMLTGPERPEAVFCYCAHEAELLLAQATRSGLGPGDLTVVTCADAPCSFGQWAIPTLLLPMAELGRRGVDMLLAKIDGCGPQPGQSLVPELLLPAG